MSKIPKNNSLDRPVNKNIKNIYVHKINSLIKLSREKIVNQEASEIIIQNKMVQKKIKKVYSESKLDDDIIDKTALKLQKNRESARKARQRKNLYIKLLQNQVVTLRKQLSESQQVEASSSKYLAQIKSSSKNCNAKIKNQHIEDDLDRYFSQDNIEQQHNNKQLNQNKIQRIDLVVSEFQYWFIPQLIKSINNLKKPQRLQLNKTIIRNAEKQDVKGHRQESIQQKEIRLLLPLEQASSEQKIGTIFKTLSRSTQQLKMLLQKFNQISSQLKELIYSQQTSNIFNIQVTDVEKNKIKQLISQYKICGVGDRIEKIVERILRWSQFPSVNMLTTMQKIIQFNCFIQKTIVQDQIINQKSQLSEMDEEKQLQLQLRQIQE